MEMLDDKSNVATPTAELTPGARQRRRWLVSHSGYIWLRRHVQVATMKRSDASTLPSGSSMRTGPCTITGPLGITCTTRGPEAVMACRP